MNGVILERSQFFHLTEREKILTFREIGKNPYQMQFTRPRQGQNRGQHQLTH